MDIIVTCPLRWYDNLNAAEVNAGLSVSICWPSSQLTSSKMKTHASKFRTAYSADRAAALAGVPKSTLHYWARTGLLVPSLSSQRVKLWTFEDLMALRVIDWLRTKRGERVGAEVKRAHLPDIRRALKRLKTIDRELWTHEDGPALRIDRSGKLFIVHDGELETPQGQLAMRGFLDLLRPFEGSSGIVGPDLRKPRPQLRIVPGKLAGEPHVLQTRIESQALAALDSRGFVVDEMLEMYPFLSRSQVKDALDLEQQLARNLAAA